MDPTFKGLSAPTPSKTGPGKNLTLRKALLIGGILIAVFALVGIVASYLTPNTTNISQRLLYRIDALTSLTTKARPEIKSATLSKINADLSLMLIGDNALLAKTIPAVQMNDALKAIKAEEADATSTDKLKTAKVNGTYDDTYKAILIQKLETSTALINELHRKTNSTSQKSTLETLASHIDVYYKQLKSL